MSEDQETLNVLIKIKTNTKSSQRKLASDIVYIH